MKKLIYSIALIILVSCDQGTKDFIEELNEGPQINFASNSDTPILTDSLKVFFDLKRDPDFYTINLTVTDPNNNLTSIEYSQLEGLGTLIQGEDTVFDNNISLNKDILEFRYYPRNYGDHRFKLEAIDDFGLTNSVRIDLVAFENLAPVAFLHVSRIGQLSRFQYRIDASESYDRDSRFGGRIEEYEYSLVQKIFNVLSDEIEFVFPSEGVYTVSVRVTDTNDVWSQSVQTTFTIE